MRSRMNMKHPCHYPGLSENVFHDCSYFLDLYVGSTENGIRENIARCKEHLVGTIMAHLLSDAALLVSYSCWLLALTDLGTTVGVLLHLFPLLDLREESVYGHFCLSPQSCQINKCWK